MVRKDGRKDGREDTGNEGGKDYSRFVSTAIASACRGKSESCVLAGVYNYWNPVY